MATPANSFEQVTEPKPDAVTVVLWQEDGADRGHVLGPVAPEPGEPPLVLAGEDTVLSAHQALAIACQIGNDLRRFVVVIDPQGVWRPEWGQLQSSSA